MAMYIRVKRIKTTYFIQCDPTETILDIKQKLYSLTDHPVSVQRLILDSTGEVLEDSKSLAEQKEIDLVKRAINHFQVFGDAESGAIPLISHAKVFNISVQVENDAVVALTLRKDDNEFEDVNIARPGDSPI